ncbi:MAG: nfo [Bacteroidetes bacterium]|jgi:deoxyribonuclease-4|nr:nfo [Bacteroidota bacterium]
MFLGTHVSIAGGYMNALTEAKRLGIDTMQIFTKNQRFWREKIISEEEGKQFREASAEHGVKQAFSHAIYLISLGSKDEQIVEKSILALQGELERCRVLGLSHTVLHPGFAGEDKIPKAITRIGDHIKTALKATKGNPVKILIENTAGQGTSIGGRLDYIADLVDYIKSPRIGICIDTCHAFAAGYDIRSKKGIKEFLTLIDKRIGYDKLLCFHLNDSKGGLASKLDRHAHIGEGLLGLEPFKYIMNHFPETPKVLETSKENDADKKNLALLRSMVVK